MLLTYSNCSCNREESAVLVSWLLQQWWQALSRRSYFSGLILELCWGEPNMTAALFHTSFRLAHPSKVLVFCLSLATHCCRQGADLDLGAGVPRECWFDVTCQKCSSYALFRYNTSWMLHDGNYFLYIKKWLFVVLAADLITCCTCSKNWLEPLECQARLLEREGNRRCNRSSWLLMHMTTFLPA